MDLSQSQQSFVPSQLGDFEDRTLLFRNIDAKVDPFSIALEKHIQNLPESLQFIKEYLYFDFLPKLDTQIENLEHIKSTSDYDENVVKIRPVISRTQTNNITVFDLLRNHNIKHPKIARIIYGTSIGSCVIYDIESDKVVSERQISPNNNRVDCLSTATTKYFDTYLTRIAVNCRSEIYIHILSFNHSFSLINLDCVINTVSANVSDPITNQNLNLSYLLNKLTFSVDGYYLNAVDYAGGVRIYKFHEIPLSNPSISADKKEEEKVSSKDKETKEKSKKGDDKTKNTEMGDQSLYMYITRVTCNLNENFTILPKDIGNPSESSKTMANAKNNAKKKEDKASAKATAKDKGKKGKDDKDANNNSLLLQPVDETIYNIKSEYDDNKNDVSLYQKYDKHHPICHFVQKKYIFEDKLSTAYSSSVITVGLYIAFANSTCFKFISLYPYLTEKMKTIFKVSKGKGSGSLSVEEAMSLNSQMAKKEREFINFVRSKLDNTPNIIKSEASAGKEQPKEKDTKDKEQDKKDSKGKKGDNKEDKPKNEIKPLPKDINPLDITKNEIDFNTLFNISAMAGQRSVNNTNNLLCIGMTDGSILVWDCELHTDKYLLQKNSRFEITSLLIDENYVMSGSKEGLIYIYDLSTGTEVFKCSHNPYETLPICLTIPFFPLLAWVFDYDDVMCLYNLKEKEKISKILLNDIDNRKLKYRLGYANEYQINYNDDFVVMLCEKEEITKPKKDLIDLIRYQETRRLYILNKVEETDAEFYNRKQIESNGAEYLKQQELIKELLEKQKEENEDADNDVNSTVEQIQPITKIEYKQKYFLIFRIRDILFKCYPDLVYAYKKGLSLKKLLQKYNSDEFPTFDKGKFAFLL